MSIQFSDIPAWWGAILSTLLAIIASIRYFMTRPRLRVNIARKQSDDFKYPNRMERVNFTIVSSHETTLTHINIRIYPTFSWKYRLRGMVIVSAALLGKGPLPRRIEAAGVFHDWLDADFLYEQHDTARGLFVFEVFDTRHKRPVRVKMKLDKEFLKSKNPREGIIHAVTVQSSGTGLIKQYANIVSDRFRVNQTRTSTGREKDTMLLEFAYGEKISLQILEEISKSVGCRLVGVSYR